MSTKRIMLAAAGVCIGLFCVWSFVGAGDLNPPAGPAPTMKTLDEIFSAAASQDPPVGAADARWVIAMQLNEYPGSWDWPGYEDHSKVVDLEYSFSIPYNKETGQATDQMQLDAICITKNIDKATPGLGKAFSTGQEISQVHLKFLWPDPEGGMEEYFRLTLRDVHIVGFAQRMVHRGGDEYAHLEVVDFVWEQMEWNWIPDSTVELIQWGAPPY